MATELGERIEKPTADHDGKTVLCVCRRTNKPTTGQITARRGRVEVIVNNLAHQLREFGNYTELIIT